MQSEREGHINIIDWGTVILGNSEGAFPLPAFDYSILHLLLALSLGTADRQSLEFRQNPIPIPIAIAIPITIQIDDPRMV